MGIGSVITIGITDTTIMTVIVIATIIAGIVSANTRRREAQLHSPHPVDRFARRVLASGALKR